MLTASRSQVRLGLAASVLVALAGCSQGTQRVTVSGTVAYKTRPVSSGMLQFIGTQGAYSVASIQKDGKFIITDVVPGEVKVAILETPQPSAGTDSSGRAVSRPSAESVKLPPKYRDADKSGLRYTITPQVKQLEIDLE